MTAAEWLSDPSKGIVRSVRKSQVRMGEIVEKTLAEKGITFIEAPTGVGKSFGYLVPAIESNKRVVVSTGKKTLQAQLRDKDLPFLLEKMQTPSVSYTSLKGKSNYLCKLRLEEFAGSEVRKRFPFETYKEFSAWVTGLTDKDPGELGDFPGELPFEYAVRVGECVWKQCEHAGTCGYRRSRTQAKTCKIVVVNHALLAYDIALGGGKILGPYDAVIIDEAHEAEPYFREAFTCRITSKQPETIRKLTSDHGFRIPEELEGRVYDFLGSLPEQGRVENPTGKSVNAAQDIWEHLHAVKNQLQQEGAWSDATEEEDEYGVNTLMSPEEARAFAKLRSAATLVARMITACEVAMDKLAPPIVEGEDVSTEPMEYVMYTETRGRDDPQREFVATPVEIGSFVAPCLRRIGTAVLTSATLSTDGNFEYVKRDLGLFRKDDVKIEEILPPAFNYPAISCQFISQKVPAYSADRKDDYWNEGAKVIDELVTASRGGAFVLCTSYEDMSKFYEYLVAKRNPAYKVKTQMNNVDALIEWFKSEPTGVALGVKSLWSGVDIPGLGLRLVVIPRIPFPSPKDPVLSAKKEKYVRACIKLGNDPKRASLNSWGKYDLQAALMELKQGGGRLIRRETDKGVVAILDARVVGTSKGYSSTIRTSLPHPVTYDLEMTKKFLTNLAAQVFTKKA